MRRLIPAMLFVATVAVAQHVPVISSRVGRVIPPSGAYRYGNILFPGGVAPHQQTHAGRLGGAIQGTYGGFPYPGRAPFGHGRQRTVVVPYAVPVYLGDPYGYGYPPQQAPNVTLVMPQQPTPSVIINHNYSSDTAKPVLRDYSGAELPDSSGLRVYEGSGRRDAEKKDDAEASPQARQTPASDKPTIYLIALTDSTVRQAIGYWVENGTLNYVTPQGTINRITLDQVDRETSKQLNTERGLEFELTTRVGKP